LGEFIVDAERREQMGIALIAFTGLTFIVSILPPLFFFLRFQTRSFRRWIFVRRNEKQRKKKL